MSKITVYNGDTELWSDTFPAWPFKALQKIARSWLRATQGTRYTIRQADGTMYYSRGAGRKG